MARGRFRHERIATAEPVRGERVIGWTAHYLIGIAFAGVLLAICGLAWARQPTLAPALALGIATVAAPFLLMQPGMGAGIAASSTPRPDSARLQGLVTHAVFGLGLYAAGLVLKLLLRRMKCASLPALPRSSSAPCSLPSWSRWCPASSSPSRRESTRDSPRSGSEAAPPLGRWRFRP
jgi:hypothetical protein